MKQTFFFYLLFLAGLMFAPTAHAQSPHPDPRFGIVESYTDPAAATDAGAGYTRIILRWDVIQPAGRDDWKPANVPDPLIETELAAGREVVAVLIGTPNWASQGVNDARAVPDMDAWGNFTKRIAQQYQGRIKTWIIWNEPDVWDMNHPGSTWLGTEADYYRLLQVAYDNIKSVDPGMQVFLTGLTYHWDAQYNREQYLSRLLKIITADPDAPAHNFYFDGVTYHLYYKPRQMFDILNEIHAMLDSFGLGEKPIWVNETNAPPTDDPLEPPWADPHFVVSTAEQANFVIQAYALLIAGGAQRIEFYKMKNSLAHPEDIEPYGLVRSDGTRRPAFDAFKVVTTYFAGFSKYEWIHEGSVYAVTLGRGDKTTTVLWNTARQDVTFTINAIAPQAILVDETGGTQPISATDGAYTLVLPGATCSAGDCFIGGAPRLLVENGSPDRRASLLPLATETPTPTPLPTPTETPSPIATALPTAKPTATPAKIAAVSTTETPALTAPNRIQPTTTAAATPVPTTLNVGRLFTPTRIVFLVVVGALLFTLFFVIQFHLWRRWRG